MRIRFRFSDSTILDVPVTEDYFAQIEMEIPEPGYYGAGTGVCERLSSLYTQSDTFGEMFLELELEGVTIES